MMGHTSSTCKKKDEAHSCAHEKKLEEEENKKLLFVGCLNSQQHACVSQRREKTKDWKEEVRAGGGEEEWAKAKLQTLFGP